MFRGVVVLENSLCALRCAKVQPLAISQVQTRQRVSCYCYFNIDSQLRASHTVAFLRRGEPADIVRLAKLREDAEITKRGHSKKGRRPRGTTNRLGVCDTLLCFRCMEFKARSEFGSCMRGGDGVRSHCKVCEQRQYLAYCSTFAGRLMALLSSARKHATKLQQKVGRENAGRYDLSKTWLVNLWLAQEGRCAYSGIVLDIRKGAPWSASLERIDNNNGYVSGNVAIVCLEFNTADFSVVATNPVHGNSQWSRWKINALSSLCSTVVDEQAWLQTVAEASQRRTSTCGPRKRRCLCEMTGNIFCNGCRTYKPRWEFSAHQRGLLGTRSECKMCARERIYAYHCTVKGRLMTLVRSARARARLLSRRGRTSAGQFDLTYEVLLEKYRSQRGRCAYSGIELSMRTHSDWRCSLERLDNAKGYVGDNIALICGEFQSTDATTRVSTSVATDRPEGSSQWSAEKVGQLLRWLNVDGLPCREIDDQSSDTLSGAATHASIQRRRQIIGKER